MADALQIADVHLTPLQSDQITEAMLDIAEAWYTLSIVARNTSSTPLFVMSSVRRLHYDEARRALVVDLSEQHAVETRDAGLPFPPRIEEIAPGREITITYRLSSPITIVDSASGHSRPRFVHIPQDVATIDCIIAADTTPPPANEYLVSHEPLPDLRQWGYLVQRSVRVTFPA